MRYKLEHIERELARVREGGCRQKINDKTDGEEPLTLYNVIISVAVMDERMKIC